jgi:cytochrome c5
MKMNMQGLAGLTLLLLLSGCVVKSGSESRSSAFANDVADAAVMGKWARSCARCHVDGEAGAPIVGDAAEWQRRLAQGETAVMRNVLEGYNSMPPLGYCMSCEVSDFRAMIAYMAGGNL